MSEATIDWPSLALELGDQLQAREHLIQCLVICPDCGPSILPSSEVVDECPQCGRPATAEISALPTPIVVALDDEDVEWLKAEMPGNVIFRSNV